MTKEQQDKLRNKIQEQNVRSGVYLRMIARNVPVGKVVIFTTEDLRDFVHFLKENF